MATTTSRGTARPRSRAPGPGPRSRGRLEKSGRKEPADPDHFYRFLIQSSSDFAVLMMNVKGRIISWNEGAKAIFGYPQEEAIGRHVSMIFNHADKKIAVPALEISTAIKKGRADDERQHRRKDGSLFWASGVMWAIKDDAGNLRGLSKLVRDISERKALENTIRHQSLHDPLTGLPNRRAFSESLVLALRKAKAARTLLAVMFLDLDGFKKINDTLGHDTGDILLQETASRLSAVLRPGDTICRIGGDEFIILLDDIRRPKHAAGVIKKLLSALKGPFDIGNKKIVISVSIGASFYPSDGKSPRQLEKRADLALYRAKAAGKNCFRLYRDK